MQMQLGDIADFLEVLINFYDWKYPEKTAATLFCMCTCVAVGILASADFALKIVMMVLICKRLAAVRVWVFRLNSSHRVVLFR